MELQLFDDTQKILDEVMEITGKEVVFKKNQSLKTYAIAKAARTRMPNHIIYYKPVHNDIINYIIAHECGHMIRTYKEKNNRLMPYSTDETMNTAMQDIEKNNKVNFPPDVKSQIYPLWVNGIITQLTSIPEDIRIEKWIYGNYPGLRKTQNEGLAKQIKDISDGMSPRIKEMTPKFVYEGSSIINYCYLRILNDIIKNNVLNAMKSENYFQKAVKIFSDVTEIMKKDDSLTNSIEVSNYLAKNLGFDKWFMWKDFEDIPAGYEDTIFY